MIKYVKFWILLICLFLAGCQRADQTPTTGDYQIGMVFFDRAFVRLMRKWEIPGGAMAAIQNGKLVLFRGYGYADTDSGEPVQSDSLFRIASVSKPITAVAVLKLVENDELSLDTPAFQMLNHLQPQAGVEVDPRINEITIRHLLEHTGGWDLNASFDPMFRTREIAQAMETPAPADCPTIIRYMLGQPLDFDPGSRYAYSNFGYCVLGRVIESVSGQTYEDYVRTQILEPMGIEGMRLGRSLLEMRYPGEVRYYDPEPTLTQSVFSDESERTTWPYGGFHLEAMDAHGGWVSSAIDLARFASALQSTNQATILDSESLSLMFSRPESTYYAYGWRVRPTGKGSNWWSTGSMPGSSAILYQRSDGLIWATLFNTQPNSPGDEFLVDVITVMGQAAIMDEIVWISLILLVIIIGIGTTFVLRRRKRVQSHSRKM